MSFPPGTSGGKDISFAAYVVLFHLGWATWPFVFYPRLLALGQDTLAYALANQAIRLLVWVAPVWIYLRRIDGVSPVTYLELNQHAYRGIRVAAVLTVVNLAGAVARFGLPQSPFHSVTWNNVLGTSLLVGFIEEVPYRGFMLQKFSERTGFANATVITSILFLLVHVPGWIALHGLSADRVIFVFVFGVVMALAFRYSGSLWAPILAHSANDFISVVLFNR